MPERRTYSPDHPVTIALVGMCLAYLAKAPLLEALAERARLFGIDPNSDRFDDVAEAAGMPYCRALGLYVDRETKARAEALHFTEAHRALGAWRY